MLDFKKLGFRSGLEIHQQLDTSKLFCDCPSVLRKSEPDFVVRRKLHAVAGESGRVDIAAEHEKLRDNEFLYEGYDENTCLVELDEEPPHRINEDALDIALQISLLFNAKIIPLSQVMRKIVVDGSNTSGFQRSVMIAEEGFVRTSEGKVRIKGIFLEEDSARVVKREGNEVVYRLDRLGIPLVEVTTYPDIKSPEQAKETALKIGEILRSCKVRRGIGTIRQDINISVDRSNRVELKGFQEPRTMVQVVKNEVRRQLEFVKKKKKNPSEVRNVLPSGETEFLRPMPSEARMYPETDLPLLKISRDLINSVKNNLPRLRSEIEMELKKKGLSKEMIKVLFKQDKLDDFKELLEVVNNPGLVGKVLLVFPRELAKKQNVVDVYDVINKDVLVFILERLKEGKINESQIKEVMLRVLVGEDLSKAVIFEKADISVIEEKIMKIIKGKKGLSEKAYMGLVMKEFSGKVSGKDVIEIIRKYV